MTVGDAGPNGSLGVVRCVNEDREKRSCTQKTRRNNGKKNNLAARLSPDGSPHTGVNVRRGGGLASHCAALVWGILFFRARLSTRGCRYRNREYPGGGVWNILEITGFSQ